MAETIRVCDCPKDVEVLLDPNSSTMNYINKWLLSSTTVITSGKIVCPALDKKVRIQVAARPGNIFHLFCCELMDEKCPFANYESPET